MSVCIDAAGWTEIDVDDSVVVDDPPAPSYFWDILLEVAQERNELELLKMIVDRLKGLEDVALARIWLIRPGDICTTCPMRQAIRVALSIPPAGRQQSEQCVSVDVFPYLSRRL